MSVPTAPRGTQAAGRRLWRAVLSGFELEEHELVLLRQAVAVADVCEELQRVVDAEGPLLAGQDGAPRSHPALVELRAQRILLARLVVALRVPLGEQLGSQPEWGRSQRRGTRGFYAVRGGAA